MARGAIAGDAVVIKGRRFKRASRVAKVAILVCRDMVYRRIFTFSVYTVVTAFAAVGNPGVIKHPGGKTAGNVTHRTIFRSGVKKVPGT